jgi:hypothetical protein
MRAILAASDSIFQSNFLLRSFLYKAKKSGAFKKNGSRGLRDALPNVFVLIAYRNFYGLFYGRTKFRCKTARIYAKPRD